MGRHIRYGFALVIWCSLLVACGGGGGGGVAGDVGVGIDSNGGEIQVLDTSIPIYGTKIIIPKDAIPPGQSINISIKYSKLLSEPAPNSVIQSSNVIILEKDKSFSFAKPVTVSIPYNDNIVGPNGVPLVFYWDVNYKKSRLSRC